jgi:HSP20 family molecular chaperone IbpA
MERYTESPELITSVDSEQSQLVLEFSLINIEKENITLMMNENGCYLSAVSDDSNYVATLSFISPVKPSEAKAVFSGGLLIVKAPFKEPLDNYVQVTVE